MFIDGYGKWQIKWENFLCEDCCAYFKTSSGFCRTVRTLWLLTTSPAITETAIPAVAKIQGGGWLSLIHAPPKDATPIISTSDLH